MSAMMRLSSSISSPVRMRRSEKCFPSSTPEILLRIYSSATLVSRRIGRTTIFFCRRTTSQVSRTITGSISRQYSRRKVLLRATTASMEMLTTTLPAAFPAAVVTGTLPVQT